MADIIGSVLHIGFSCFGLFCNSALIYVVAKVSPKNIQTYSILLLNFGVTDWLTCVFELMLQMRTIPYQDNILYIPNGICASFGPRVCWVFYTFLMCLYAHTNYSLLASFLFRLYVVYFSNPKKILLWLFLLVVFSPTIFQFSILLPYGISQWNTNFTSLMGEIYPEIDTKKVTIFGSAHVGSDWRATVASAQLILPIFPMTVIVLIIRSWILWKLKKHTMSDGMRRMHRSLLKALTLQMLLPLFYIIGTVMYMVTQFGLVHGPFYEYGIYVSMGVIPAVSPLFPLIFVGPYYDWVRVNLFCCQPTRVGPNSSSNRPMVMNGSQQGHVHGTTNTGTAA